VDGGYERSTSESSDGAKHRGSQKSSASVSVTLINSEKGGGKCVCLRSFVCLSVSRITEKGVHGFGCRDMDELISF